MELIKNFGIDPILLGAQVVNFLIVLFILHRVLYKPILQLLQKRKDSIIEGLKIQEDAQKRMEQVLIDEKKILRNAQVQAKKIIDDATSESQELSKKIEEDAKKHSEKVLKDAYIKISQETKDAERKLTLKISDLAIKFLQSALLQTFSQQEQKEIMRKVVGKLNE